MADNITLEATVTAGRTVATDQIGSVDYPRGKLTLGADGVNDGDVSKTNPLPIGGNTAKDGSGTEYRLLVDSDGNLQVDVVSSASIAVTGTFWQTTQPVSGTVTANAGTGTFAVSAASLPLPSGAATAAKQPALGTAGTAASDVLTVQGIASMTALKVDGSAVTQPVSDGGSTLSIDDGGGSITVDGTVAVSGSVAVTGTFWQATQPVSLASVPSHAVTNAGTFAVQAAQTGTWNVGLSAGTNAIGKLAANSGVTIGAVEIASSQTIGLAAGTNTIGNATPAVATGGASPLKLISAASTNATSVKGSAGTLYALVVTNINAAVRYLKLYNKASAPTVGTDTPVLTIAIPGNTAGAGVVVPIPACGIAFGTGIAMALTTGAADSDTAAVAANEIIVAGAYK